MKAALRKSLWRSGEILLPVLVLLSALVLRWIDPAFMQDLRHRVFDQYQEFKPRPYDPNWHVPRSSVGVGIVDVDEESLARYGQWPWPRDLMARLFGSLHTQGAAGLAVDMVFAEPDRTSLDAVISRLDQIDAYAALREQLNVLRNRDQTLISNDDFLAATLQQLPNTVLGFSFSNRATEHVPTLKKGVIVSGSHPFSVLPAFTGATANLPVLDESAAGMGSINVLKDRDGVIRRVPLVFALGNTVEDAVLYPSLVAEVLRVVQGQEQSVRIKSSDGSGETSLADAPVSVVRARIGEIDIPTDASGQITLWDSGHQPERYVPAWKILENQVAVEQIEGRIFFLGTSAPGLVDLRSSPLESIIPGVEIHAQIAEQILTQSYLNRPDYASGLELLVIAFFGTVLIIAIRYSNALLGAVVGAVAVLGAVAWSWIAFDRWQLLFDPLYPALAALAVYLIASILHFVRSEADKRQVRSAFGRYLSPALVEQLAQHPERLRLGGEMRDMSVLFCDIRGFTTISEQFDPPGLTRFINAFLTPMTEVILAQRGTIDKYIGDCIMAFWNAPVDVPDHAASACRAALRMFERLAILNVELSEEAKREGRRHIPINIGAGINSGPICVGNMGSDMRFDYSVLGDAVNLASRLEGQSKNYGVDIVIGEATEQAIRGQFATLELDMIKVKGKHVPVRIYTVLGEIAMLSTDAFKQHADKHQQMLQAYRDRQWQLSDQYCRELSTARPDMGAFYQMMRGRIEAFRADPPKEDWDGVFAASSK